MLWLYQRTMFGKLDKPENQTLRDLNLRELATFLPLIVLAVWIGIYPKTFLQYLDQPVVQIVQRIRPDLLQGLELKTAEAPAPAQPAEAKK